MNLPSVLLAAGCCLGGTTPEHGIRTPAPNAVQSDDAPSYVRTHLGIELSVTQSRIRRRMISTRTPHGFLIAGVEPHSPAARAGLERGDILLEWEGVPIREVEDLVDHVRKVRAEAGSAAVRYARKRENAPLTFPATDPWETRQTRIRPAAARSRPGRPI